jgi:ferredoxin
VALHRRGKLKEKSLPNLAYIKNVVTIALDPAKCNGCRTCLSVCPHGVYEMIGGKSSFRDRDACMECGACALNCPEGAISVDPGVGCAAAILKGWLTRSKPSCDC